MIEEEEPHQDLVEQVYGREREFPCEHGHFDCAVIERGPCAGEVLDRLIRRREAEADVRPG
jgi:hypothetical protein